MPLRDDLLQPIPGDNPSGINMRYERVYDQIKEARVEDDDTLPAGAWERQAKRADSTLVIKLASEVLLTKSKDLQIAAWLGEAHIKKEGAGQLLPVLTLLQSLQETFWDTVYPEIDEGDAGLRAVPVQWAANRYATLVYQLPITKSGVNYYTYKSARALGYAADAEDNQAKSDARKEALSRGQLTAEELDDSIATSPKSFYANLDPLLQQSSEKLEQMALFCEEKYGDDGPTFRKLRDSLDEVHNIVNSLLNEKRKSDPDEIVEADSEPEADAHTEPEDADESAAEETAAPVAKSRSTAAKVSATGRPPASWEEAAAQIHACAAYMSSEGPRSPIPYLLHSALRWGELREHGSSPPLEVLVPPASETRSGMKLAASNSDWDDVRNLGLAAMAEPCGRCWLDVHRYLWTATTELGFPEFPLTIVAQVQVLLREYPDMPEWTFLDDTSVANGETKRWIEEEILPGMQSKVDSATSAASTYVPPPPPYSGDAAADDGQPDVFAEASGLAASGHLSAAMAMLTRDSALQTSGRMRSQRRVEIAELCLGAGNSAVAASILREVVVEMEQRRLDTWETRETVVRPLALLLRCTSADASSPDWEARFARLCALDPGAALEINP